MTQRVAILGFGFSGLMVAAQLVKRATNALTVYLIAPQMDGRGLAYSTTDRQHWLNVPAAKMGAYPDAIDDFYRWLKTVEGALSKQRHGIAAHYTETDFVPRAIYGDYLADIWRRCQEYAAQKNITLKLVETYATAVQTGAPLTVLTERGDAIAVDAVVLATGHETKPVLPQLPVHAVIQNPWAAGALEGAKNWQSPVALMGVGLTAVDTIMSLRAAGYAGEIIAFSRHGLLPQAHVFGVEEYTFDDAALLAQKSLRALVRFVRRAITQHVAAGGNWRAVVDALRPHTQTLWRQLSTRDQQRVLARLLPFWSVHRHRMAPEIAATMAAEMAAGKLRIIASKRFDAVEENGRILLRFTHDKAVVSRIINCTGPEMTIARSRSTLLRQLLADGALEPHATGLGVAADPALRAWGALHPHLFVAGPLMTGQLLESTAVPELRGQAERIAKTILV